MNIFLIVRRCCVYLELDAHRVAIGIEALPEYTVAITILKCGLPDNQIITVGKCGDPRTSLIFIGLGIYSGFRTNRIASSIIALRIHAVLITILIERFPNHDKPTIMQRRNCGVVLEKRRMRIDNKLVAWQELRVVQIRNGIVTDCGDIDRSVTNHSQRPTVTLNTCVAVIEYPLDLHTGRRAVVSVLIGNLLQDVININL